MLSNKNCKLLITTLCQASLHSILTIFLGVQHYYLHLETQEIVVPRKLCQLIKAQLIKAKLGFYTLSH